MSEARFQKICAKADQYRIETLCAVMQRGGLAQRMRAFRKKYDALLEKHRRLLAELQKKGATLGEMAQAKDMLDALAKQREEELDATKAQVKQLEDEKDALEAQLDAEKKRVATTALDAEQKAQRVADLELQLKARDDNIEELKEKEDALEERLERHDKADAELKAGMEKTEMEKKALQDERDKLVELLQAVNEDYKKMREDLGEDKGQEGTVVKLETTPLEKAAPVVVSQVADPRVTKNEDVEALEALTKGDLIKELNETELRGVRDALVAQHGLKKVKDLKKLSKEVLVAALRGALEEGKVYLVRGVEYSKGGKGRY